ncbi:MAG: hypothetical protein V7603_6826, partial [Micromonosporaceae bacterium]
MDPDVTSCARGCAAACTTDKGSNGSGTVATIVAGMLPRAVSIADWTSFANAVCADDVGSFLRACTPGVSRQFLVRSARRVPLLPSAGSV